MSSLLPSFPPKYIFVLLGPSGSGKTTYGQTQLKDAGENNVMFLSTGLELRKRNLLNVWQVPNLTSIKDICRKLIKEALDNFKKSKTQRILLLDGVKDLEDAEYVCDEALKHGLKVTRALLFDISPADLDQNWRRRGEDRDMFHGTSHRYLKRWNVKSKDLVSYFIKLNQLCTTSFAKINDYDFPSLQDFIDFPFGVLNDFPVLPSPNNVHALLINSGSITRILSELLSVLKIHQFHFTLPASFVHSHRDVAWVSSPSRYHVSAKVDGVRCLLVKVLNRTYLITRKTQIYPCYISDDNLANNTVLDGELLPSKSISEIHPKISTALETSVFIVFDVLAISADASWKLPFSERHECLRNLPLSKDIPAVMNQASEDGKSSTTQSLQSLPAKGTSLDGFRVHCVVKEHKSSTPNEIIELLGSLSQLPYACDGLVFTPNTTYIFGPDPLLFKWQSEESVHCDILGTDLTCGKRKCVKLDLTLPLRKESKNKTLEDFCFSLNEGKVIECRWNLSEKAWDPLFIRLDKNGPNSDETIDHVEKLCQQPYTLDHFTADLAEISDYVGDVTGTSESAQSVVCHPLAGYSFDDLYGKITELIRLGYVEKTVDPVSNLEVLNYSTSLRDPLVSLCRGLVLHPGTKTIVTKPFVRFFESLEGEPDPNVNVEATIKYDGSLGIAFMWNDDVLVTTRRRMNSEQALWAKQWIKEHCNLTKFQAGYTYLFEIIYKNNTVVVNYLFEGLVLLAISDKIGHELPYEELLHCARAIGFLMVTPRINGPYSEILWYCGGIDVTMPRSTAFSNPSFISGALPTRKRQEGWVIKFEDGSRQKIVFLWWKEVSRMAYLVHPQIVWLLVKHDKIEEIIESVPSHFRTEIHRMIRALGRKFVEIAENVKTHLTASSPVALKSGNNVHSEWRFSALSPITNDFEDCEEDADEEATELDERAQQLRLDVYDAMENNNRACKNEEGPTREGGLIMTSQTAHTNDFLRLARRLEPYLEITSKPKSISQSYDIHGNVNFSPIFNWEKANYLRLPILDFICPATSPAFEGYEPSENFKRTWCKSWKPLPINEIRFIQEVFQKDHQLPQLLWLPGEVIDMLLQFLDGKSVAMMARVCVQLRQIIRASQVLRNKILMAKMQHESDMMASRSVPSFYSSSNYFHDYSYWGGCGSY